jgi:F-type H+-transporting ATPase subunit delta
MTDISSSRRYAQAVLDIADQDGSLPAWQADLDLLASLWSGDIPRAFFEDAHQSVHTRMQRARQVLGPRLSSQGLNLVLLLLERERTALIPYIARQFADLLRERAHQVVVQVTTALPLTPAQRDALVQRMQQTAGVSVTVEETVDPAVIGGMVLRAGDQLLDLSIEGRLRRLHEQVVGRVAEAG